MNLPRRSAIAAIVTSCALHGSVVRADEVPVVDVPIDVNRRLPQVWLLPADKASQAETAALGRVLAMAGLYEPVTGKVGQKETGVSVQIKVTDSTRPGVSLLETSSIQPASKKKTRRLAEIARDSRAVDLARIADAVVMDLTGQRSHLSGSIVFTDLSTPGARVVRAALATGEEERAVSPPDAFARGADFGPGGRVYFAMSRPGEALKLFVEGDPSPLPTRLPEDVQMVAISAAGDRLALAAGAPSGSAVWQGPLGGPFEKISTGEISLEPAFGPDGKLAYTAGPARGPLRVFVGDAPVSAPGVWAASPSFCGQGADRRVAYGSSDGVIRLSGGGGTSVVGRGQSPVCSPDGRTILFAREGSAPGLFTAGVDGITPRRIRVGAATNLRWSPGRPLPPEG